MGRYGADLTFLRPFFTFREAYGIDDSATFDSNAQLSYPDDAARKLYPDAPNLIPPNHPKNPLWNSLSSAAVTNNTLAFIDNVVRHFCGPIFTISTALSWICVPYVGVWCYPLLPAPGIGRYGADMTFLRPFSASR